ncbi:MAG: branched-chain amino acid ABC transporter permease [Candidatus Cloacimonetes bacterium]|nr:branched-chain amino acid ABC transporter permease [Candidatus Cloacimonadota bacterium]
MLLQLILNSVISGSIYALVAIGFTVIYRTVKFFHFAHAVVFTSGAYFTFLFHKLFGFSIYFSIPFAIIFALLLGCLIEKSIYKPLRKKQASSMILLLSSLGIYILLQNLISMVFGDDTKSIRTGIVKEGINIFGARITPIQITIIITSIIITTLLLLFLKKTKIGKAMQAVANDAELANISGINSDRVILSAFAIGSGLAGLAGILVALDVDMTPTMGMNALMMGVVVVIIGGVNSIPGIVCGALLLGFAQNFGVWYISSQWKDAIAFGILILFLLFKPEGFFGKKMRKVSV